MNKDTPAPPGEHPSVSKGASAPPGSSLGEQKYPCSPRITHQGTKIPLLPQESII